MSKFFTYEDRLFLQKYLKDSLSFKEIARRMDKNPTTISRESVNIAHVLPLAIPGSLSMPVNSDSIAGRKRSVEKSVPVNQISTVSSVSPVIPTVQTSWKKSAWQGFGCPMSAMAVRPLASVRL